MRRTRAVAITAFVAASALVLAACGNSPGQADGNTTPQTPNTQTSAPGTPDSSAPGTDTNTPGPGSGTDAPSTDTSGEPGGDTSNGCGTPHGAYDAPAAQAGSVNVSFNEGMTSWNPNTAHSNSVYNSYPLYLTQASAFYYDDSLNLINNDSFMTCKVDSLDPLTITYTINKAAKWSDGVPVTAADLLMSWAAAGGHYNTADYFDKDGNVAKLGPEDIAFDSSSDAMALVTEFPTISDDQSSLTIKYTKFFVDYPFQLAIGVPAHVVAQKALEISDPAEATAALVDAFKANLADKAAKKAEVKKISDFWNTGFDFTELPSDPALYLSSGAYKMTAFVKDQYLTFEANPDYTWGPKPSIQTITYKIIGDPMAAVQALQNGEVDVVAPQATTDVLKAVQALEPQGVTTSTGDGATYEHVDLAENNGGPFDPATYGGDKDKALKVRKAFLKTIPRQDIIDRLIKPLNPNAVLRQSFNVVPGSPDYEDTVAQNGSADWTTVDIEGAKALLAEAGATNPEVRFMYADKNPRRANEYQLIAASAEQAGFKMVDGKNADWSSQLPNTKIYDAALFGWQSTAVGASQIPPNFKTDGQNNFYGYSNPDVDKALDSLNLEPDPAKQKALIIEVEKHLWADGFGTVLFQFPSVLSFNSKKVQNVKDLALAPNYFWNFWEWTIPAS